MSSSQEENHLAFLEQGASKWNEWRLKNSRIVPNLAKTDLTDCDLSGYDLSGANLTEANLSGCSLQGASLEGAKLRDSKLVKAKLSTISLCGADLRQVDFSGANLLEADLSGANLAGAVFKEADLWGAKLHDALLTEADLTNADLRRAKGVQLDGSLVSGTHFSPKATDPWSRLRRAYTGPMMALHFAILVIFLAPYAVKALFWSAVNRSQMVFLEAQDQTLELVSKASKDSDGLLEQILERGEWSVIETRENLRIRTEYLASVVTEKLLRATVEHTRKLQPCLSGLCDEPQSVGMLLLDVRKGWGTAILAITLILYNALRACLTREVALLRDAEERSKRSPERKEYSRKWLAHKWLMSWLSIVAGVAVAYQLWVLLVQTKIYLPHI